MKTLTSYERKQNSQYLDNLNISFFGCSGDFVSSTWWVLMDEIPQINSPNGVQRFLAWLEDLKADKTERELNL